MTFVVDNSLIENLSDTKRYRLATSVQASANSTFTFSTSSNGGVIFTGTTAGQIVSLGDARTYSVGQEFWIYNESIQAVSIRNSAGTILQSLSFEQRAKAVLQDNSTSSGIWVLSASSKAAVGVGSTSVAFFTDTNNNVSNKFLTSWGIAASDLQPAVIPTSSTIRTVTFCGSNAAPTGTIEFRVNTTVGAASLSVTLSTLTNTQVFTGLSLAVSPGDSLNCKIATGASGVGKPVVICYL
jgi:hypothetical protein